MKVANRALKAFAMSLQRASDGNILVMIYRIRDIPLLKTSQPIPGEWIMLSNTEAWMALSERRQDNCLYRVVCRYFRHFTRQPWELSEEERKLNSQEISETLSGINNC